VDDKGGEEEPRKAAGKRRGDGLKRKVSRSRGGEDSTHNEKRGVPAKHSVMDEQIPFEVRREKLSLRWKSH